MKNLYSYICRNSCFAVTTLYEDTAMKIIKNVGRFEIIDSGTVILPIGESDFFIKIDNFEIRMIFNFIDDASKNKVESSEGVNSVHIYVNHLRKTVHNGSAIKFESIGYIDGREISMAFSLDSPPNDFRIVHYTIVFSN